MIYLDNAATTFPKPQSVRTATAQAFSYSANPGRAGHRLSLRASEAVYNCRSRLCELLNFDKPENIILTPSCTVALNTVIKGILSAGDHVVISSLEHNSVVRPIEKLASAGVITYDVAEVFEGDDERTLNSFRKSLRDNTRLVICTHASNVFGIKLPVSRIGALCRYYGVLFCVDTAQTAGVVDIDLSTLDADFICAPGHKGLYGPMGTGVLVINTDTVPDSLCEGGTGSGSSELLQPSMLPDKFESGTLNLTGIAGLTAGVDFVMRRGPAAIYTHELTIMTKLYDRLSNMNEVQLYTSRPGPNTHVPLLSFNIKGKNSEETARALDEHFGIAVRAGLHCSPLAHKHFGTEDTGTVRICPSVFTTDSDIVSAANAIYRLSKDKKFYI